MSDFSTSATVDLQLDDGSLSGIRDQVESELSEVQVGIADGGSMSGQMRGGSGRVRRRARRSFRLAQQRTEDLSEAVSLLDDIEEKVGGGGGGGGLIGSLGGAAAGAGAPLIGKGAALAGLGVGGGVGLAGIGIGAGMGLASGDFPAAIGEAVNDSLEGVADVTEEVSDGLNDAFDTAVTGTVDISETVASEAGDAFDSAVTNTADVAKTVASEAGDAFDSAVTNTADVAKTVTTEAGDAFDSAIDGTADIADSAAEAFAGAVDGAIPDSIEPSLNVSPQANLSLGGSQTFETESVDAGAIKSLSAETVAVDAGAATFVTGGALSGEGSGGSGSSGSDGGRIVPGQQSDPGPPPSSDSGDNVGFVEGFGKFGSNLVDDPVDTATNIPGATAETLDDALPADLDDTFTSTASGVSGGAVGGSIIPGLGTASGAIGGGLIGFTTAQLTALTSGGAGNGQFTAPTKFSTQAGGPSTQRSINAAPTNIEEISSTANAEMDIAIEASFDEVEDELDNLRQKVERELSQLESDLKDEIEKEISRLERDISSR